MFRRNTKIYPTSSININTPYPSKIPGLNIKNKTINKSILKKDTINTDNEKIKKITKNINMVKNILNKDTINSKNIYNNDIFDSNEIYKMIDLYYLININKNIELYVFTIKNNSVYLENVYNNLSINYDNYNAQCVDYDSDGEEHLVCYDILGKYKYNKNYINIDNDLVTKNMFVNIYITKLYLFNKYNKYQKIYNKFLNDKDINIITNSNNIKFNYDIDYNNLDDEETIKNKSKDKFYSFYSKFYDKLRIYKENSQEYYGGNKKKIIKDHKYIKYKKYLNKKTLEELQKNCKNKNIKYKRKSNGHVLNISKKTLIKKLCNYKFDKKN